jgi:lipopolysaccharide transport system ATP-binding protein
MAEPSIRAFSLGKRYQLSEGQRFDRFSQQLTHAATAPARALRRLVGGPPAEERGPDFLWALREVEFEVAPGEVVGVIGRNGAGKSTLLKILSRITEPSEGRVEMRGRVGSLLEVGTGFHPELTGRENVFLNGSILGMSRAEIAARFDEMIAFAELERFVEVPVKRYSSGMYMRLAFAVAAHLESEILLVDEVLAVGDAEFQKRCLSKLEDVSHTGRAVLLVSHNLNAVRRLCGRALLLEGSRLAFDGPAGDAIDRYLGAEATGGRRWIPTEAPGDERARLLAVHTTDAQGAPRSEFDLKEPIRVELEHEALEALAHPLSCQIRVLDASGLLVFVSEEIPEGDADLERVVGSPYVSSCEIPPNLLNEGLYSLSVYVTTPAQGRIHLHEEQAATFRVGDDMLPGSNRQLGYLGPVPGVIRPLLPWSLRRA